MEKSSADVIVIGGGIAGLTAAARAAKQGASVILIERKTMLGGRGGSENLDGFTFNQGGHALYAAGAGIRVLDQLGITPDGASPPLKGMGYRGGELAALPAGAGSLMSTSLLGARSKLAFGKVFAKLPRLEAAEYASVTAGDWVDAMTSDAPAREVLHAICRLSSYANAPSLVSAEAVIGQLQGSQSGVLYLHGGWQTMVEQLAAESLRSGVDIRPGVSAESVRSVDGTWHVQTDDGLILATSVVLAGMSPVISARLLGLDDEAFSHAGPPAEAAVLDLSLDGEPEHRFLLGIDKPTYFSVHGPPASMAPAGCAAAVAMKYLPVGQDTDVADDRDDLEAIAAAAGLPAERHRRFLRRMTVTHGMPVASQGGLAGRPSVEIDQCPGVYLAGDWVGREGMLADAAFASADRAGRQAAEVAASMRAGSAA